MADGKNKIILSIINLLPETPPIEWMIPNKDMIITQNPYHWQFTLALDGIYRDLNLNSEPKYTIHNLLDGCQYIESALPYGDKLNIGLTWNNIYQNGIANAIQRIINQTKPLPPTIIKKNHTIVMFDHGKNVCQAKVPKQMERRIGRLNDALGKTKKKKESIEQELTKIEFPFDDIKHCYINDHDRIPEKVRAFSIFSSYHAKIVDYMIERIQTKTGSYINIEKSKKNKHNLSIWNKGIVSSKKKDPEFDKIITHALQNIGEFDYAILRYILTIIDQKLLKKNNNNPTSSSSSTAKFKKNIKDEIGDCIFNIYSTDTDITLNTLYLIEFIQKKYDLSDNQLPRILIISPWHSKRIIHITNLYITLRYIFNQHCQNHSNYIIRSFVMTMYSWGNDLMPSPYFIVSECFTQVFLHWRILSGLLITENDDLSSYRINGNNFKLLYYLVYSYKHLSQKSKEKLLSFQDKPKELEQFIIHSFNTEKQKLDTTKKPQDIENIKSRLTSTNIMFYSIEHAIRNVIGHDDYELSKLKIENLSYINIYEEYLKRVNPEAHEKALKYHFITPHKCVYFAPSLIPNKNIDDYINDLVLYAHDIFHYVHFQERDPFLIF